MSRLSFKGTRTEVLAELEERAVQRRLWGQDRKAEECESAARAIESGQTEVTAVQTTYTVE